jgi:hypothetical protein
MIMMTIITVSAFSKARADDVSDLSDYIRNSNAKAHIVKPAKGLLKFQYIVPAGPYTQLFDWDAYFVGVALSYDGVGTPLAGSSKDFLEFVGQKGKYLGYVPREIAPDGLWALPTLPGGWALKIAMALKDYKWIAQYLDWIMVVLRDLTPPSMRALPEQCKPILAQMALRASLTMHDFNWISPYYNRLKQTIGYWESSRQSKSGLFVWHNGLESGVDNSIVVSNSPVEVTAGVDLQVYMYREYQALSVIAENLGKIEDVALFNTKAQRLHDLILEKMWSEQDAFFYNVNTRDGSQIRTRTWTGFTALWAKIATPDQGRRMISEHLLNEREFWAPYGVRTVSARNKLYDAQTGYWRGPVWVISNYISMHALLNYGFANEALNLAHTTTKLLRDDFRKTGGMNECYNPETGEPIANGDFLSWNLLAEHMVSEAVSGFDPTEISN